MGGAIDHSENMIYFYPEYIMAYIIRSNAKQEIGDLKGACEDWKKAAELGDEDAAKLVEKHCQ